MCELAALIFDVDGTLADTERDGHRVAFNAAFADAGLDWRWSVELYGELLVITGGKERIRYYLDRYRVDYRRPDDLDGFIAELHRSKTRYYTQMLAEGKIPLRPGVKRLLQEARAQGVRLAIATTTTPENVSALLEHSLHPDAMSWFDVIAAGDIVPSKKPAPDIYEYALKALDLSPESCLAFEDSYNGIRASRGADLTTIVAVNDYTRTHEFSEAALVVDHFGEPDRPFAILRGEARDATYLNMALLRAIHERNQNVVNRREL
jgi:HAD superfamily hydrolase (TIGR01509 family)